MALNKPSSTWPSSGFRLVKNEGGTEFTEKFARPMRSIHAGKGVPLVWMGLCMTVFDPPCAYGGETRLRIGNLGNVS